MNRFAFLLPKSMLIKYVKSHASELTVEDFFKLSSKIRLSPSIISNNDALSRDSSVLNYYIENNMLGISSFQDVAFSQECINKIVENIDRISDEEILNRPLLLNCEPLCEKVIFNNPDNVKKLDVSKVTDKIVSILEQKNYIPSSDDISKYPIFLNSEKLLSNAIEINPNIILTIDDPSEALISVALSKGFKPQMQHFLNNPNLLKSKNLIETSFSQDPSMIVYFDENDLTPDLIDNAISRGYIPSENDLIKNPGLCNNEKIMTLATNSDPRLVIYTGANCNSYGFAVKALNGYKITKEDIENHPEITKNEFIMKNLPEFSLYSSFQDENKKIEIINESLRKGFNPTIDDLPFLDERYGGQLEVKDIPELLSCLNIKVDENNQSKHIDNLNRIVTSVVRLRYARDKNTFKFPSCESLGSALSEAFRSNDPSKLKRLVLDVNTFVNGIIHVDEIEKQFNNFYDEFVKSGKLTKETTSDFFNYILNMHQSVYEGKEIKKVKDEIIPKIGLTEKKINSILTGRKVDKVAKCIASNNFEKLGITAEQFYDEIEKVKQSILSNKKILNSGVTNIEAIVNSAFNRFLFYGEVKEKDLQYSTFSIEESNYILNKINGIRFKYVDNITLSKEESTISQSVKDKFGTLNENIHLVGSKDRYINNISKLINSLDKEHITKILGNKDLAKEVSFLIPYLDLVQDFDVNSFVMIISNYDRIKSKISQKEGIDGNLSPDIILKNLNDIIMLGEDYESVDDLTLMALGKDIVSVIGDNSASNHLDHYYKMMNKQESIVPPVFLQTNDFSFKSGDFANPERLLLQYMPKESETHCLSIYEPASKEALVEKTGDLILVKNSKNEVISRFILMRRGNLVNVVTSSGDNNKYPVEVFKEIGDQIIKQSMASDDNIDYVFVTDLTIDGLDRIDDSRFESRFPHVDKYPYSFLASSKKLVQGVNEDEIKLDFDVEPKCTYKKQRSSISYNPSTAQLTRLKALNVLMQQDPIKKEEMSLTFEPCYMGDYHYAICGEDWYVGIKKDGNVEEIALPTSDKNQELERMEANDSLISMLEELINAEEEEKSAGRA